MNGYKYRGKRIQLEQLFKILTQRFVPADENRSSLQQFNTLVENSWKLTINKYKEIALNLPKNIETNMHKIKTTMRNTIFFLYIFIFIFPYLKI